MRLYIGRTYKFTAEGEVPLVGVLESIWKDGTHWFRGGSKEFGFEQGALSRLGPKLVIQLDDIKERNDPLQFLADASEIGLPPGHWPEELETSIGNMQPFRRSHIYTKEEELVEVVYEQPDSGATLTIIND